MRVLLLQLQQQRGVLHLDQVVHVLESRLHESDLALDAVVAESDGLSDGIFGAGHEVAREQLDELVLDVLNEV